MTVPASDYRAQYATNGTTGPFSVPFYFLDSTHLGVTHTDANGAETLLALDTHYGVTGAGNPAGGTVTTVTAYPAGGYLTILRRVPLTQLIDYKENEKFPAETHERGLDTLTMISQQLQEVLNRALVFSPSDPAGSTLPAAAARASKIVAFNSSGQLVMLSGVDASSASALQLALASAALTSEGDAMVAVKLTDANAVATTQHAVNEAEPRNPKLHFASPWDNVTSSSTGLQNAVNAAYASGRGEVFLPDGGSAGIRLDTAIELNDQAGSGNYRPAIRLYGAGKHRTRLLSRVAGPLLKYTLTQAQGDASSFGRGLEIAHLSIVGDGSTPAGSKGLSLQGVYMPWVHDALVSGMLSDGIETPSDVRWANPDRYSCAEVSLERVTILSCGGHAGKNQAFATAWKTKDCYIVSNAAGGLHLEGSNHLIEGGAIAGNGTSGLATSAGLYIARSAGGTPQNCRIHNVEFDANWVNHVRTNGMNTLISRNRFVDAVVAGAFRAPVAVRVVALTGQGADSNVIEYNAARFDNQGAVNVTFLQFDLDVNDGRVVRYNRGRYNTMQPNGATSGIVTEVDFGTNPTLSASVGNVYYTQAEPEGFTKNGFTQRDASLATSTETITLGWRPKRIDMMGFLSSAGDIVTMGHADSIGNNRGLYYYPTGTAWGDAGSNVALVFRTGAGDQVAVHVSAITDTGFALTYTKTGAPTGTTDIKWMAVR